MVPILKIRHFYGYHYHQKWVDFNTRIGSTTTFSYFDFPLHPPRLHQQNLAQASFVFTRNYQSNLFRTFLVYIYFVCKRKLAWAKSGLDYYLYTTISADRARFWVYSLHLKIRAGPRPNLPIDLQLRLSFNPGRAWVNPFTLAKLVQDEPKRGLGPGRAWVNPFTLVKLVQDEPKRGLGPGQFQIQNARSVT